ncbi:MAG: hypothetical protein GWN67_04810, partial [Phycisphaerae bacterium]|nr:hypothetical protein [Candidatus Saccharibacteria bacterium]NIU55727.1 hypothetical protein [Phycisphaerae bacterium]NIV13574.1 hypothetical protein [Fodinibius sp.]NIW92198.1 hypothetical protein [Phycisphaerae bacterium]
PDEITYRWAKEPPEIKQRDTGLAERLRRGCDKKIDNNLTYRLLEIESQDIGVELQFTTGDYEEYYETCEALTWELGNVLLSFYEKEKERIRGKKLTGHEILEIVSSDLALRNSIEPFDFLSRCMTAGINTLTIMAFESLQKNFFLMHDRSQSGKPEEEPEGKDEKVEVDEFVAGLAKSFGRMPRKPSEGNKTQEGLAEAIDTWHVVPAGTFQPLTEGDNCRDIELRIERNILREFGEELLNKRKLIEQLGIIHPNRPFEEDCELKHLKKVFSTRATEVRFLGCGIDCVSLKPEFLTLIVTNGDLLLSGIKLRKLRNNWEGKHQFKEFSIESLDKWLKRDDVLPAGAGCIALCLRHHDDVENLIASVIATGSIS